ncbi:MAG: metabolite traffic protein EboE [Kiritimatiellia bacterium]|nr:metabolite traffic protein EboE [Kiritimatiellia bacterium]MDD4442475.1 metabolite traffic protein EboE [Kiritimatiellia bacterium]MDX9793118.1 metabolite traffic protein EboE [Kiritimatiellia bacterium]
MMSAIPYCLNIHPGESLAEVRDVIECHTRAVKARVCPDAPYPLGLRLSAAATEELTSDRAVLDAFAAQLRQHALFVTGINGFPYGTFHQTAVKMAVYQPDWATPERLTYTARLAAVLAGLLPEGATGNISTVPLGYKRQRSEVEDQTSEGRRKREEGRGRQDRGGGMRDESDAQRMTVYVRQLAVMAEFLDDLSVREGRDIVLALEPEPDCLLETTDDVIRWFEDDLLYQGIRWLSGSGRRTHDAAEALLRRRIGLCLDTCHFAVAFEDPLTALIRFESACLRVARIQLSAALRATISEDSLRRLHDFIDPVYLHQTKIRLPRGRIAAYPDLTEATLDAARGQAGCEVRTHFHVPLFFEGDGVLASTHTDLTPAFFGRARASRIPLEVETYTFDVLPPDLRAPTVIDSLVRELEWVGARADAEK